MSRTNPFLLLLWGLAAAVVMWALQVWITAGGSPTFIPSVPFGMTLLLIAAATLVTGWPVRRYTQSVRRALAAERDLPGSSVGGDARQLAAHWRAAKQHRVSPSRATLAVALAKASSLGGAIFVGACSATVLWLVSRTVVGSGIGSSAFSTGCAALLLTIGLLVEYWCLLPPDDGEPDALASEAA